MPIEWYTGDGKYIKTTKTKPVPIKKEYARNKETGSLYELKPDKYKQYPHLQKLKEEIENITYGSKEYWKLRCQYLEKTIDETYSIFERDNCRAFYMMLARKK